MANTLDSLVVLVLKAMDVYCMYKDSVLKSNIIYVIGVGYRIVCALCCVQYKSLPYTILCDVLAVVKLLWRNPLLLC